MVCFLDLSESGIKPRNIFQATKDASAKEPQKLRNLTSKFASESGTKFINELRKKAGFCYNPN